MNASGNSIGISVIVPSYNAAATIERCLRSLRDQTCREPYEVIVVDSSVDRTPEIVRERFPEVRLQHFPGRLWPGGARNAAIRQAGGRVLAFTDADCVVDSHWIEEILKAHGEDPTPVIGGAVDNANPDCYPGWGFYFSEYGQWLPELSGRSMVEVPTSCLSIKRWAFERYGPFLERGYCSDTVFQWKLGRDGHATRFVPAIRVAHANSGRLWQGFRHKTMHGRAFARARWREQRFSRPRRLAYAVLSPLLPLLLFFRTAGRVFRKRIYRQEFMLASPIVLFSLIGWSLGEFLGYLDPGDESGRGGSARHP